MPREFRKWLELPGVAVPDWELLRRLEELFRQYMPITTDPGGYPLFHATDSRGEYDAPSVKRLREEIEEQEEPPSEIRVFVNGINPYKHMYELGVTMATGLSRALFISTDEQIVNHCAIRTQELFERAAHAPSAEPAQPASPSTSSSSLRHTSTLPTTTPTSTESFLARHAGAVLTGIISTVIGGLIVGLLLYVLIGN